MNGRERIFDLIFASEIDDVSVAGCDFRLVSLDVKHPAMVVDLYLNSVGHSLDVLIGDHGFNFRISDNVWPERIFEIR